MMSGTRFAVAVVAVGSLGLSACSDDGAASDASTQDAATEERAVDFTPGAPWAEDDAWTVLNDEVASGSQQITFRPSAVIVPGAYTTPAGAEILNPLLMTAEGFRSCEALGITRDQLGDAWDVGVSTDRVVPEGVGSALVDVTELPAGSWVTFLDTEDHLIGAPVDDVRMYTEADMELAGGLGNLTAPVPLLEARCLTTPEGSVLTPATVPSGQPVVAGLYAADDVTRAEQLASVAEEVGDVGDVELDVAVTVGRQLQLMQDDRFWVCAQATETALINAEIDSVTSCFARTPFQ